MSTGPYIADASAEQIRNTLYRRTMGLPDFFPVDEEVATREAGNNADALAYIDSSEIPWQQWRRAFAAGIAQLDVHVHFGFLRRDASGVHSNMVGIREALTALRSSYSHLQSHLGRAEPGSAAWHSIEFYMRYLSELGFSDGGSINKAFMKSLFEFEKFRRTLSSLTSPIIFFSAIKGDVDSADKTVRIPSVANALSMHRLLEDILDFASSRDSKLQLSWNVVRRAIEAREVGGRNLVDAILANEGAIAERLRAENKDWYIDDANGAGAIVMPVFHNYHLMWQLLSKRIWLSFMKIVDVVHDGDASYDARQLRRRIDALRRIPIDDRDVWSREVAMVHGAVDAIGGIANAFAAAPTLGAKLIGEIDFYDWLSPMRFLYFVQQTNIGSLNMKLNGKAGLDAQRSITPFHPSNPAEVMELTCDVTAFASQLEWKGESVELDFSVHSSEEGGLMRIENSDGILAGTLSGMVDEPALQPALVRNVFNAGLAVHGNTIQIPVGLRG